MGKLWRNMFFLLVFSVFIIGLTGCGGSGSEEKFTLGFLPTEQATEITPKAEALSAFLEEQMGMPVEIVVPSSYEPLIEGLRFGHLDAAFMDSGPGWMAHQKAGAEVVLAELKKGEPFYYGEVFVHVDSDYETLSDVMGKRIAFTSFTGSSGFILPVGTMVERGLLAPEGDDFAALEKALQDNFESYAAAGGYKQALTLLVEGKADIAGGAHDAPEKYLEEEDRAKLRTLERLGKVPSHPVMVHKELDAGVKEKFVNAMLLLNEEENLPLLKDLYGVDGLVEADTTGHLGDFGPAFEALTGIHDKVFAKKK